MKKLVFLAMICMILSVSNVFAYGRDGTVSLIESGIGAYLCQYKNDDGAVQNEIMYIFEAIGETEAQKNAKDTWNVFYRNKAGVLTHMESTWIGMNLTQGSFDWVFRKKERVSYGWTGQRMEASMENRFECPKHSFIDYDWNHEMCFGDNDVCGSNFEKGPFKSVEFSESIFYVMNNNIKAAYLQVTFDEYKNSKNTIDGLIKSKALAATKTRYQFDTVYVTPEFVKNYIEKHSILEEDFNALKSRMAQEEQKAIDAGTLTEEEKQELEKKKAVNFNDFTGGGLVPPVNPSEGTDCNSILGNEMTEVINNIFKTIQYAGPILVILLTAADILKVVLNGEMNEMKKISNKFMKRLIAAMLLFFVPLLCSVVFDVVGITVPDSCIGQLK